MTKETEKTKAPQIYWELEVKDKNGKILEKKRVAAKSWLVAFITILKGHFGSECYYNIGGGNASVVDEGGTARTFPYVASNNLYSFGCLGVATAVYDGIIVGSDNTPNSITTYKLVTKILHGSTSGLLLYGASSIEDVTNPSGNDLQFRMTRAFTNNSGATITVKEIGILGYGKDSGPAARSWLIARDVLPSPSDVPDGATLTIRYIVKITVA